MLKILLELANIEEQFQYDDDLKYCTFFNFVYKEAYLVMTSGNLSAKNSFLTYFDLGLTLGLCLSVYLKQPTVSLSDENSKRPYLMKPALKKNISLIHKNLTLLKNLSSCIRKLSNV